MATRAKLGTTVFDQAIERLVALYREGNRLVISFSAGKDSGVVLELAVIAARLAGRLPVDVVMRDEEIMYPGTFEYAERVYQRKEEVNLHWLVAFQPVINIFDREHPYFWVFDQEIPPEEWVRMYPPWAQFIVHKNIEKMTTLDRFPVEGGGQLMSVLGIRVQESRGRMYGLYSAKGYVTKPNAVGVRSVWPIYDWSDGDVWKAISENHWDYNQAYDVMYRMGMPRSRLRIAPPTMNTAGAEALQVAAKAWPKWFDRVCKRLQGVRSAALFGKRAVEPHRRLSETWEQCFHRECIEEAPAWVRQRALEVKRIALSYHKHHSTTPLPEVTACYNCINNVGSWKALAHAMWNGDPFGHKMHGFLKDVEPEFFRPGAGTWGGTPGFA